MDSNDDCDKCIITECIPAKKIKLPSSYMSSLYKHKHTCLMMDIALVKYFSKQFNPNKAGFFEGSFFWGRSKFEPPQHHPPPPYIS